MFLEKLKPTSNGHRKISRYTKFFIPTKFHFKQKLSHKGGCGRNILGIITTKHRQTNRSLKTLPLRKIIYLSNTLLILSFNWVYKYRIPIVELKDRFGNRYINRAVSGLTYGELIYIFPNNINWEVYDYLGNRVTLIMLVRGVVFCDLNNIYKKNLISTSAGTYCSLVEHNYEFNLTKIIIPSGVFKILSSMTLCTVGRVGFEKYNKVIIGKAGNYRRLGFRPSVRGVAMNAVDHPHGGRTKTNSPEKSPWGWITKYSH